MASSWPQVLVVDDEPDLCWALTKSLTRSGYRVTTAASGAGALEMIAASQYSVAFVDAKLPDVDGLDLAAAMRRISPSTSIVLISGYYYQDDRTVSDGLAQGLLDGFVAKPFAINAIREMARQAAERFLTRRQALCRES